MFEKRADTRIDIIDALALRWSGRAYDPDRPVEQHKLTAMLEAARWAPSCYGDQPWRYVIWNRLEAVEPWRRAFACLSEGNQRWAGHAPILMLASADSLFRDGRPNRWGSHDTGAASMSLAVQGTALGLMVHQMGGFDAAKIRTQFAVPDRYEPVAMIAIGYQLPPDRIPDEIAEREFAPRNRLPLGENFYVSEWGRPLN